MELFTPQTHFYRLKLRSFASVDSPSIFLTINHRRPCWITCANLSKSPHALYLKRRRWPPIFFAFLAQVTHCLTALKIHRVENFRANVLNDNIFVVWSVNDWGRTALPLRFWRLKKRIYYHFALDTCSSVKNKLL